MKDTRIPEVPRIPPPSESQQHPTVAENRQTLGDDRLQLGFYFVAILDILGQSDGLRNLEDAFLRQLSSMTESSTRAGFVPNEQVVAAVRNTFGFVMTLQQALQKNFSRLNSSRPYFDLLPAEKQNVLADMWHFDLRLEAFADSVVIYVSLRGTPVPPMGVYMALHSCCSVISPMLALGKAIRGGAAVGVAGEYGAGHLYGHALALAHDLEASVAQYPRVVIGNRLLEYLDSQSTIRGLDDTAKVTRWAVQLCRGLISEDTDGLPILDYLGESYRQSLGLLDVSDSVRRAYSFVDNELSRQRAAGNLKLIVRYGGLRHYFRSRANIWGMTTEE